MKKLNRFWIYPVLIIEMFILLSSNCRKDEDDNNPPVDFEGKVYQTVSIGTQEWMAENLRTTKLNDGTDIEFVDFNIDRWSSMVTPGFNVYYPGFGVYNNEFFYNGYVIKTGKLAPEGWHVPTEADWIKLIDYLGGEYYAGGKMKTTGTTYWLPPNMGATNSSGFSGFPAGQCDSTGIFMNSGMIGYWWSSTWDDGGNSLLKISLYSFTDAVSSNAGRINSGYSVRCVRD